MDTLFSRSRMVAFVTFLVFLTACSGPQTETGKDRSAVPDADPGRHFSFSYSVQVQPTTKALDIFLPIAQSNAQQQILGMEILSELEGELGEESRYGNEFWHLNLPDGLADTLDISIVYQVLRPVISAGTRNLNEIPGLNENEKLLFLSANSHVPVAGALVDSIRGKLEPAAPHSLAKARSIYDYVVANMEYKKVGTGWGNGDTYWACSEQYGNCTDFHALFTSLARAEGIPSRFEIGFPVPLDKAEGVIGGYHCWVYFYLPETGWFPIDASEARKDLNKKDLLFGTQPADRIQFTIGRDLELGQGHQSGPLNYFIYPHIEGDGEIYTRFTRTFSYKQL